MAPTKPQSHGVPLIPLAILAGLCALAVDALHLQLGRAGFDDIAAPLRDPIDDRVRKHFTGLPGLDNFISTLLILFLPIFTGERPELSLFSFYFAGQGISCATLVVVQGMRQGKQWNITKFSTFWGLLTQIVGYGVVQPLYYFIDLVFSSSQPKDLGLEDPTLLHAVIPTFLLAFVFPSGLLSLPLPKDLHQLILLAWQPFPVYVTILMKVFSEAVKRTTATSSNRKKTVVDMEALDHAYNFAITVGAVTHWVTIATIVAAMFQPDLFSAGLAQHLTFMKVFVPNPVHWYGASTVADVIFQFLQYDLYIGSASGLVWAAVQASRAGAWSLNVEGLRRIVREVLAFGPPSAVLSLLWSRDDAIFNSE